MIFKHDSLGKLRVAVLDDKPWFIASDVAKILDYSRVKNFLLHVQQSNTQIASSSKCDLGFLESKSMLINNEGLQESLDKMTGIRSQIADRLKKWIKRDILPNFEKKEAVIAEKEKNCEDLEMHVNGLEVFYSEEFGTLRTIENDGKIMFIASDVAKMLGYTNTSKAISDHCKGVTKRYTLTNGGRQELNIIPEGDVYRLVAHSKLPKAEQFEAWVFDNVLPTIRQTGSYQKPMSQLEILQGSIQKLIEQEREIARIKLTQQEQEENLQAVNKRVDDLNGVCIEGTKRQRLVTLVNAYARKAGLTYDKAWNIFRDCYNKAFHTNIGLVIKNYMVKNNITKKPSIPEFLELKGLLDDGIRIADKMLATVK